MLENHEKFKDVTAGIQSIVIAVALLIGGLWTAYIFIHGKTKEQAELSQAQLSLAKNQLDIATMEAAQTKNQAEQKRQANYGLDITIDAKQEQLAGRDYIAALVKITNKGINNRFIDFSKPPFRVSKVEFYGNGNSVLQYAYLQMNLTSDSIVLRTGTTADYPFLVRVPDKGFYMVSFAVELNKEELEVHKESGGPDVEGISWGADVYVLIK